jgi:hypothetical protein
MYSQFIDSNTWPSGGNVWTFFGGVKFIRLLYTYKTLLRLRVVRFIASYDLVAYAMSAPASTSPPLHPQPALLPLPTLEDFEVFAPPPAKVAPAEGTTFQFQVMKHDKKISSECMWSAGRLGSLATRTQETAKVSGRAFQVQILTLPATRRIANPQKPDSHCLWPVFFRGKLAREPPTQESLEEHVEWSPMGHVSQADKVSWFATDPATALNYGYPDVYTVPVGRTLRLLDVGDPTTVEFVHEYYQVHHKQFERAVEGALLSPNAARTAFILNRQRDRVERGTEWRTVSTCWPTSGWTGGRSTGHP